MVKGQQAKSGSAASGKEKDSTQTKQSCLCVSADGRQYQSRNVTTNNVLPSPMGGSVPAPPSWHTYSDQRLPLSASQDQFVLTDEIYLNRQDAISRTSQAISFQNPSSELPYNNYAYPQSGPQQLLAHPPSTAHLGVNNYDPAALWDSSISGANGFDFQNMLVTGAHGEDPFLPLPGGHCDDDIMVDFPMDTGVDVMRHAGGMGGAEGMDVFDQLDLSALGDFPCLPNDMDLIDPVSLSPTMAPLQSSELDGSNFLPTLIPIQSSDVLASSIPMVAPSAAILPANIQAVVPPPIVPSAAHPQAGDIGDCLQLLKLMKPSKSNPKDTSRGTHTSLHQSNSCTPVAIPLADSPQVRAPPPSLPLSSPSAPIINVVMTPTTPGYPVCASASSLLHCSFGTTATEHVFVITDCATGMRRSAAMFCAHLFRQLQEAGSKSCGLQVVYDRLAKLPVASVEDNKLVLKIPKDCIPLAQWIKQCQDIREHVLVVQEIVNTLASIHAGGADEPLSIWGSFSVWVGAKGPGKGPGKVYLVPDFPELLQKQQEATSYEQEVNPAIFDQLAVSQLVEQVMSSCSRCQLLSAPLARKLSDIARGNVNHMIQVGRVLGEKRMCRLDISCPGVGTVEVFCLEQEKLIDALQPVKTFLPGTISPLWGAYWAYNTQGHVQNTEVSTPDRMMVFTVAPQKEPVASSTKSVFIRAN